MIGGLIKWANEAEDYNSGGGPTCNIFVGDVISEYTDLDISVMPHTYFRSRYPLAKEWYKGAKEIKVIKYTFANKPTLLGDIVAFSLGHVGIYLGNNLYISSTASDDLNIQDNFAVIIKRPPTQKVTKHKFGHIR